MAMNAVLATVVDCGQAIIVIGMEAAEINSLLV
jgi:hypothetical protein